MSRKRHERRSVGVFARTLMLLAAFLLFMTYASMVVNPAKAWYMTFLGLMFVPVVLLNVLLLIWSLRRKSKAFLIPLLALLPSFIFIGRYFQVSSGGEEGGEGTMKIMSYNVGRFMLGRDKEFKGEEGRKACIDSLIAFIKKTDADVVCLQEVDSDGEYDVSNFIEKHFPDYQSGYFMFINNGGAYGNVTLSKYPIVGKGRLQFDKSSNLAIYTDLEIGDRTLRIYNCHFESYNISLANLVKAWRRDSTFVRSTEAKLKRSITRRPLQVDQVMSDIEECPVEAIVTGDFNDNPMSYTYYRLMKGRRDSFVEAGKGFGATYSGLRPFIRIDYILFPKDLEAVSNKIPHLKYSDHYPVIAEITVRNSYQ